MVRRHQVGLFLVVLLLLSVTVGCGSKKPNSSEQSGPIVPTAGSGVSGSKEQPQTPSIPDVDRLGWPVIVAFGDSLTFGKDVDSERNYPSQLQQELDRLGYKYRVVNAGISGDTTAGGLGRIQSVLAHSPKIVILELGANDGLRGQSLEAMRSNLAKMIERFQGQGIQVVLAGMQIPPNYGPEYTGTFRQTFIDLAEQYKVPLIPFFLDGVAAKPELNLPDGTHPTAEGYEYVTKNVMSVLEPLLEK